MRLILDPDLNSGEVAALVHDRFQRKGLGQKLSMQRVIEIARRKGLDEIHGEVLTDNRKMLGLCESSDSQPKCSQAA